ncbi:uncharacterized protein METZ01_LOCUS235895, partial [marine metagenome]
NTLPSLEPIADTDVEEGELLSVVIAASDDDGEELEFIAENLPVSLGAALIVEDGSARIEWTPPYDIADVTSEDKSSSFEITVKALDGSRETSEGNLQTFTIKVVNKNQEPVVEGELSLVQSGVEGDLLEFGVTFRDPDLDQLTLTLEGGPDGAELTDNGDGTGLFVWQTDFDSSTAEGHEVTVVATDDSGDTASQSTRIVLENVNQDPVLEEIEALSLVELDSVLVPFSASDPDNAEELLRFELEGNIPSEGVLLVGESLLVETDLGDAGEYELVLRVFDTEESMAELTVTLTVEATNLPPVLGDLEAFYSAVDGDLVEIVVEASDPDEDAIELLVEGAPEGSSFSEGVFSWQTGESVGVYDLTFTVQEVENAENAESVSTQLEVFAAEGAIVRGLRSEGNREKVTLRFDLQVIGEGQADLIVSLDDNELETLTLDPASDQLIELDTSAYGLDTVTSYTIVVSTVVDIKNDFQVGV